MKTVVTGGAGFIGSHLVKRLVEDKRNIVVADKSPLDGANNLKRLEAKVEYCQVDLRSFHEALAVIEGADSVFHLAAHVGNMAYIHGNQAAELFTLQSNLLIDANVFRACLETGVKRIVCASSCAVYPMGRQLTAGAIFAEKENEFTQSWLSDFRPGTINPDGGYGWSKLISEIQLNWTKNIAVSIARLFNIYGEYECIGVEAHVVGDLIHRLIVSLEGDFIVYGDGKQARDFLYISDCINALLELEEKATTPPLTLNIGSGAAVSISKLANTILGISGKNFNLIFDSARTTGPVSRTADISKAKELLDWEPTVNLDEGLRRTYAWVERKLMGKCS